MDKTTTLAWAVGFHSHVAGVEAAVRACGTLGVRVCLAPTDGAKAPSGEEPPFALACCCHRRRRRGGWKVHSKLWDTRARVLFSECARGQSWRVSGKGERRVLIVCTAAAVVEVWRLVSPACLREKDWYGIQKRRPTNTSDQVFPQESTAWCLLPRTSRAPTQRSEGVTIGVRLWVRFFRARTCP